MRRIVSFLPSATEMACALGLAESIVGITHECDYPPEIKSKPVVVRNVLPLERMSQSEIDRAVAERIRDGQSLYQIDEELLRELAELTDRSFSAVRNILTRRSVHRRSSGATVQRESSR